MGRQKTGNKKQKKGLRRVCSGGKKMISNSISMHVKARCIRLLGSGSRTVGALLTLLVMLLVSAAPAVGQLDTGGIAGTILDPTGKVDRVVEMPVTNITSCAFGGKDLRTLFITTASVSSGAQDRLAGCLFAFEPGVRGLPENLFRMI